MMRVYVWVAVPSFPGGVVVPRPVESLEQAATSMAIPALERRRAEMCIDWCIWTSV
jgi:hypothetical protein